MAAVPADGRGGRRVRRRAVRPDGALVSATALAEQRGLPGRRRRPPVRVQALPPRRLVCRRGRLGAGPGRARDRLRGSLRGAGAAAGRQPVRRTGCPRRPAAVRAVAMGGRNETAAAGRRRPLPGLRPPHRPVPRGRGRLPQRPSAPARQPEHHARRAAAGNRAAPGRRPRRPRRRPGRPGPGAAERTRAFLGRPARRRVARQHPPHRPGTGAARFRPGRAGWHGT